jgi:hypothetical protein
LKCYINIKLEDTSMNRTSPGSGDLVTVGDFSSPRDIRSLLKTIRVDARATFSILAVFELPNRWLAPKANAQSSSFPEFAPNAPLSLRSRKLFRSLLFATHHRPAEGKALQAALLAEGLSVNVELPAEEVVWSRQAIETLLKQRPFSCLTQYQILEDCHLTAISASAAADSIHPIKVAVILGLPHGALAIPKILHNHLARLSELIERSEAAVVNRSMTLTDTIDCVLRDCEEVTKTQLLESTPSNTVPELLELSELARLAGMVSRAALLLTGSEDADIFLTGKDPDNLFRAASCAARISRPGRSVDHVALDPDIKLSFPLTPLARFNKDSHSRLTKSDSQSVVQHVHSTGKPLIINELADFIEMHDTVHYAPAPEARHSKNLANVKELAVPLALSGALAKGDPSIFGVLNLEKRQGRYTGNDVFIARQLAQYFCLQRSQVLNEAATRIVFRAKSDEIVADAFSVHTVRSYCQLRVEPPTSTDGPPLEFWLASEPIKLFLEALYVSTRSSHVTVRVASTDGLRLYRYAEWPSGKGDKTHAIISSRLRSSVNSWVFRHGMQCSINNIDSQHELLSYPGLEGVIRTEHSSSASPKEPRLDRVKDAFARRNLCKSELCLPLRVRGRILGTLDLESMFIGAYRGKEQAIYSIAEEIVQVLSNAQQSFEHQLFMILATTKLTSHEILGIADELTVKAAEFPGMLSDASLSESRDYLSRLADRLREIISQVSSISFARPTRKTHTLRQLVNVARGQGGTLREFVFQDPDRLLDTLFEEDIAFRLILIMKPIIRNAISATDMTPHGTVRLIPRRLSRGGRDFISLSISNPLERRQIPNARMANALFRVPIATDRWHLGTFMAGVLARSLGGDVYVVFNPKPKLSGKKSNVQVIIELPYPDNVSQPAPQ